MAKKRSNRNNSRRKSANNFAAGVMAGEEQKKSNPFNLILGRFQEAQARRYKEDMERKKEEGELSKALQVLGFKHDYDKELTRIEAEEKRKTEISQQESEATATQKLLTSFGMGEQNIPPGTTAKVGNFTIPLNPKLTQEQGASVAAAKEVEDDVNSFKTLLTKHAGEKGVIAKLTLPYAFVGGDTEEMKRITDQLRARIPFAKGGKQLTPFEAKTLFQLLPQPGQNKETINKNLDKFVSEFNKMSEIAIKGTAGTRQQQAQSNIPYKAGDVKIIKGISYQRNEAGQWMPKS